MVKVDFQSKVIKPKSNHSNPHARCKWNKNIIVQYIRTGATLDLRFISNKICALNELSLFNLIGITSWEKSKPCNYSDRLVLALLQWY